ncbi:MAG: TetR/AcrR family transcriptional regulator [Erysipelotrichaceae bacterium]
MKTDDALVIENIKKVTLKKLSTHGAKGWNMGQLAAESGVAKDTLYRIIDSKENLIKNVLLDYIEASKHRIVSIIQEDGAYLDKFTPIIAELTDFASTLSIQNIQDILRIFPHLAQDISTRMNEVDAHIVDFLAYGVKHGFLKQDVDPLVVFGLFESTILYALTKEDQKNTKHTLTLSLVYLLRGIVHETPSW